VILAAGESSRLGQCKALAPVSVGMPGTQGTSRTPLELLAEAGAALGGAPPLVVTGADHDAIAAAAGAGVEVARNLDWSAGRSGGVLLAARLRPGHDLCVAPVDTPLVPAAVFAALARLWREAGSPSRGWAAPYVVSGVGPEASRAFGHPILIGRELALRIADRGPGAPLRTLRALADPLLGVEVAAREILDDLDFPDDLTRLQRRSGA
jgi:CTP:molybdopterin cytidylyltransferase MocA